MVFAFNPASRATSTKVAPSEVIGFSETEAAACGPCTRLASARACSSGSTSAVRLRDFKNARREEDKRGNTFPSLDRVRMRRYFYSERLPTFANLGRGPDRCKSPVFSSTVSGVWLSQQSSWQSLARRPLRLATLNFPAALGRVSSSAL